MVALCIRAGVALAGDTALGVRLLAPVMAALGTLLLVRAGDDLLPGRRAGLAAAILLNATLLLGVGAVTMTPDTPLLLFWTATLCAAGRLLATGDGRWWLAVGVAAGLALDSKYSAALLAPALLGWMLLAPDARRWLRTPWPWLGALLAVVAFSPALAWNAAHGWASFLKQGGRVGDFSPGEAAGYLTELVFGQIGLATPGLAALFAAGIVATLKRDPGRLLLALCAAAPLAVFAQHALGDRVQANWPAIAFPAAAIAAAGLGGEWRRWRAPAAALGAAVTACVYVQAIAAPWPLSTTFDPTLTRLGGWPDFARDVEMWAARTGAGYIAADNYALASRLAWESCARPVVAIEPRWAFFHLPAAEKTLASGPGLMLRSARRADAPDPRQWASVDPLGDIPRARRGVAAETYRLYRVTARDAGFAAALLPSRGDCHAPAHS